MRKSTLIIMILLSVSTLAMSQVEQAQPLNVYIEQEGNWVVIYADNNEIFPQSVSLDLDYKGLTFNGTKKEFYLVPPGEVKFRVAELKANGGSKLRFSYKYTTYVGDIPNAKHDNSFSYLLPFQSDESFELTQAYGGKFSHRDKKALDFTMPEGTLIVAARGGLVIKLKEDSNFGCAEARCLESSNFVTILHDDGSVGQYFHLRKDGASVELGQTVESGDLIGYSGNTGFTSGPHLHFEVAIPTKKGFKTVATEFMINGTKQPLIRGNYYKAEKSN